MFGVNRFNVNFDHYLVSPLSSEARVYALPHDLRERVEGIDSLMRIIGLYVSPGKILLANSLRLLPLHAVERAGARKLRGSFTKAAALWIRQQYPEGWRPQGARQFHTTELH